jgi:hypothetical protein
MFSSLCPALVPDCEKESQTLGSGFNHEAFSKAMLKNSLRSSQQKIL